jgi:hypothetical protein
MHAITTLQKFFQAILTKILREPVGSLALVLTVVIVVFIVYDKATLRGDLTVQLEQEYDINQFGILGPPEFTFHLKLSNRGRLPVLLSETATLVATLENMPQATFVRLRSGSYARGQFELYVPAATDSFVVLASLSVEGLINPVASLDMPEHGLTYNNEANYVRLQKAILDFLQNLRRQSKSIPVSIVINTLEREHHRSNTIMIAPEPVILKYKEVTDSSLQTWRQTFIRYGKKIPKAKR